MRWQETHKEDKKKQWHKWFAWYPIKIDRDTYVWLEYVERKGTIDPFLYGPLYTWEYKEII